MVAAHPAAPPPGSLWEFGFDDVDALEVWNGGRNLDDEVSLRIWQRLPREGRRVAAELTASSRDAAEAAGPGQTLRVPPATPVTVTAMVTGAAGTNAALITAAGCAGRATVGGSALIPRS